MSTAKAAHNRFGLTYAFTKGAALGLSFGTLYWLALCAYLYGSDHAWWTGAPSTSGQDWRIVLERIGLHPSYWQLPAACMVVGAILGSLVRGLGVNTRLVWQAVRFGYTVVAKNWYWMLALLLLPLSNLLAAFFTGHRTAYSEPAERFRPQWSFPGWLAVVLCFLVNASSSYSDLFFSLVHSYLVAATLLIFMSIYDALADQLCAGIWLEKCKKVGAVRLVLHRLLRPAIIRDAFALGLCLDLLVIILLLPPIFFAAVFLFYEAPQLEANMKSSGIVVPTAFLWCTSLFSLARGYGWIFMVAPIGVFSSICNAKLFQLSQTPR